MPYDTKMLRPVDAMKLVADTIVTIENSISSVTDRGDPRLNGMAFTKKLRSILEHLRNIRSRLPKAPDVDQLDDYLLYRTSRKRGMLRSEHLKNVVEILSTLRTVSTPEFSRCVLDILNELNEVEFPSYTMTRKKPKR